MPLTRCLRYYLISFAFHAAMLGLLACAVTWKAFAPPEFYLRTGGGSGGGGLDAGDAFVVEGEFLPCSQTTEVHINPPPAAHCAVRSELTDVQTVESGRLVAPSVEPRQIARKDEPPLPEPPPAPPPLAAAKVAPRVKEQVELPPLPPASQFASATVGDLLKGSSGARAAPSSGAGTSDARHDAFHAGGGLGGGGGSDGLPTGAGGNVLPPYPPEALARGIEGVVTLRVVIDEEGAVQSAKLETSSGDAALDQSALATVRDRWHFRPARRYGIPVECEVLVPIRFRLRAGG